MIAKLFINYNRLQDIQLDPDGIIALLSHGLASALNDNRPTPSAKLYTIEDIECSINLALKPGAEADPPLEETHP